MNISQMIELKALKQQFVLILSAFAIVVLGGTFIYCVIQWHLDWQLAERPLPAPSTISNDATNTLIASIPNYHLFGQAKSDVPISNLQLQVTGIVKIISDDNAASKAYISIAGQPSKIYQVDDSLPDGVKIYDITSDAVIIQNEGHLEKLPLPREKLQFKVREPLENS